ncbi:MAG TPA: glycosyltransferase family 4 protein [Methylomirabilota bacterium]|nr:glycosyltransferase family 4 protein [Methylomirabilota bacterium]
MRILIAASVPRRREGGVAGVALSYAEELERRGHRVATLFMEDLLPAPRLGRFYELRLAARVSTYIRRHAAELDIVNLHAPIGCVYGVRHLTLRQGPPYVMTLHGLEENRVHAMTREHRKGRAWHFAWKNRVWHSFYHQPRFDCAIRTADGAHCFSRDVWAILRLKYGLDDERVAYIPNGVAERFFIARTYRREGPPRLLMPGTWLDQRGIFYLREALPRILRRVPGARITFAGPGVEPSDLRGFFGPEAASGVDVLPTVSWQDMPQLYGEHDILLFPSLMEGQPLALLEAMAAGMPVVTTETCGMPDVVEDGFNGMLIPPADAVALENAVANLAGSPETQERLGRAARESMRRHAWASSARRLEEFFARVSALHLRRRNKAE